MSTADIRILLFYCSADTEPIFFQSFFQGRQPSVRRISGRYSFSYFPHTSTETARHSGYALMFGCYINPWLEMLSLTVVKRRHVSNPWQQRIHNDDTQLLQLLLCRTRITAVCYYSNNTWQYNTLNNIFYGWMVWNTGTTA